MDNYLYSESNGFESDKESDVESILDDVIGVTHDISMYDDPLGCSFEQTVELRRQLHKYGKAAFLVSPSTLAFSNQKLCTAFGIPQMFVCDRSVKQLKIILDRAIDFHIQTRSKLLNFSTVEDVSQALRDAKNIVVLSGAGISTSLGIPDFRTEGTGLYAQLAHLGLTDPQEVFSMSLFREDPSIFYSIAKYVYPPVLEKFTPTHAFIRLLQDKGKLLTNYTQNVDNVEAAAGISRDRLVQCHGSFRKATCLECGARFPGPSLESKIRASKVPRCSICPAPESRQTGKKRKRGSRIKGGKAKRRKDPWEDDDEEDDEFSIVESGVIKPDITFFDEKLPQRYFESLERDRKHADLILIIGTSLQVDPVNNDIVHGFPRNIPQVYINLKPVENFNLDVQLLGQSDIVVQELCRQVGWELKHELLCESREIHVEPIEDRLARFNFSTGTIEY
ncbi:MAG: NAD-dependent histone deacetylase sir2 [Vezdaea aestivalis]|nr:MAG: NAD-dependent histone deacetylase sir2 [Vezdaea aestivalis]